MVPPSLKRTRVLEVIGNAIVGGMESWVEQLVSRLPDTQFEVIALCPFESPFTYRLRALGIEVVIAPMPESPLWDSIQTAVTLVSARHIDLLHAHLPNAHVLAGIVGSLTAKPVLTTIHGRQMTMLDLEVHRTCATHVSVVCRHSYFHALSLGTAAGRLSCEPNGIDTARFKPSQQRSGVLRDALHLGPMTPLVGFIGRLSPEKGPDVFIRAALLLQGLQPDAHCVLVGEGPMESALRTLTDKLGLADRVHFAGLLRDMPGVYQDLDLSVSSSHSEAMPLALIEAMSSGLPVVATRVGGVPEIVEHGQSGWLVAPGDFEDIAARVDAILSDASLRQKMGQTARLRAMSSFGLDRSAERVAQLLIRLGGAVTVPQSGPAEKTVSGISARRPRRLGVAHNGVTPTQ